MKIKYDQLLDEYIKVVKALEVAESALKKYKDTSVRGWSMEDKRKDIFVAEYALEQIEKIKKGE